MDEKNGGGGPPPKKLCWKGGVKFFEWWVPGDLSKKLSPVLPIFYVYND